MISMKVSGIIEGLQKKISPKQITPAMQLVAARIASDAVHVAPKPPVETGYLRGAVSHSYDPKRRVARVTFATHYAIYVHEASEIEASTWPSRQEDPDVGPQFLAQKLKDHGKTYNRILAESLR